MVAIKDNVERFYIQVKHHHWQYALSTKASNLEHNYVAMGYLNVDSISVMKHEIIKAWEYLSTIIFTKVIEESPFL